jgi:hypothetical protein
VPTYGWLATFAADFDSLSPEQQAALLEAIAHFVEDLRGGKRFRRGLRVRAVKGAAGIFEMTWADDGRATFEYGEQVQEGEPHIVWRRVGTHAVFDKP